MNANTSQSGQRFVQLTEAEAAQRFRALGESLVRKGGNASQTECYEWAVTGMSCGEHVAVEARLRLWLSQPGPPFERAGWLRLLGTALWRQRKLPEAVDSFRAALDVLTKVKVSQLGSPRRRKNFFEPERGLHLLWKTLAGLAAEGVHAFATAGTLLGLEREGGLLAHDKDLDIGVFMAELKKADQVLQAMGWRRSDLGHRFVNFFSYQDTRSGMEIDLLGFALEEGSGKLLGGFWLEGVPWGWQRVLEYPLPDALRRATSPAGPIWCLPDPDAWLSALYGGDWRTPDTDFDTVISACNLRGFTLLTQCYAYSRIVLRWLNMELPKAQSLTHQVLRRHTPGDTLLLRVESCLAEALQPE